MSHPPDYADYADTAPPLDMPDDFGTETEPGPPRGWIITGLALSAWAVTIGALILWSTLS